MFQTVARAVVLVDTVPRQVWLYSDRLEIISPGRLRDGIRTERMRVGISSFRGGHNCR